MALEMELTYRLRWMDFDRYGHIQPWALLDLFQDTATAHALEMGIGQADMDRLGVFWAIIRVKYEMVRDLEHHQKVTVRTWPHSLSRFSFIRDFELTDEAGNVCVRATSEWVLMDRKERKFASVKDYYSGSTDFIEDRAFPKKARKISSFEEGNRPVCTVIPTYSDIDVNGHVNNAMYARYAANALDPDPDHAIRTFQIDYRHEARESSELAMHTLVEDDLVRVRGVRPDGETSFICAIGR